MCQVGWWGELQVDWGHINLGEGVPHWLRAMPTLLSGRGHARLIGHIRSVLGCVPCWFDDVCGSSGIVV